MSFLACAFTTIACGQGKEILKEAAAAISRFNDGRKPAVRPKLIEKADGKDLFETSVEKGRLTVKGSSGVALCRGYYDFVKSQVAITVRIALV